jgi:surfactin synthase thioesterase subunit
MIESRVGRPTAVLGHSMGGAIALLVASRYPASVTRLLLLDVAGIVHYRSYARELTGAQVAGQGALARPLRSWSDKLFDIVSWPVGGVHLENVDLNSDLTLMPTLSSATTAAILFVRYDFGLALRSVRAPTWIGWGAHDKVAPLRTAETLRYLLKPATFTLFPDSGHVPMTSEPAALLRAIREFLESAPVPPVAPADVSGARTASCSHQADVVFEGDYEHIELDRCKRVLLRNVRARALRVVDSQVELSHVELVSDRVALVIANSRLQWTGGGIWAPTCMETTNSQLDLMGFSCVAAQEPFLVHSRSRIFASVSEVWRGPVRNPLHGDHPLQPNTAPP